MTCNRHHWRCSDRIRGIGQSPGLAGIRRGPHSVVTGTGDDGRLLAGCCQRLAALECKFTTGKSGPVRPKVWSMNGGGNPPKNA